MGDDMSYKLEEYYILNIKSYRLLEIETGEYWYPLSLFLRKFLFRNNNLNTYRDNDKYNQYMRVIEYDNPDSATDTKTKAWFMNTEGLYILLQNTRINNTGSAREKLAKENEQLKLDLETSITGRTPQYSYFEVTLPIRPPSI